MTCLAPSRMALRIAIWPTGPQPQIATVSVGSMSHCTAACQPVGKMSQRNSSFSSANAVRHLDVGGVGEGHAQIFGLAAGIAAGQMRVAEQARRACGRTPCRRDRFLRLVVSQTEKLPRLHWSHSPQMIVKGTTTRSPFFSLPLTPEPTSTTSPMVSWPMMSPGSMRRDEVVEQVQVGAADRAARDLDDGVARILDLGIGHGVAADVLLAVPDQRLHLCPPG